MWAPRPIDTPRTLAGMRRLLVALVFLAACSRSSGLDEFDFARMSALAACRDEVVLHAKDPTSVEFPTYGDPGITFRQQGGGYDISVKIRAANSYGVIMPAEVGCEVTAGGQVALTQ